MKAKEKYITLTAQALGISKERFINPSPLENETFIEFIESLHWKYYISNMGRIMKINTGKFSGTKKRPRKYKIYTALYNMNKEYPSFLSRTPIRFAKSIHRLVALTFIPNPKNKRCVNHKNGNKHDNRVENLEWNTHSENNQHAIDNNLRIPPTGINNGKGLPIAKLDDNYNIIDIFECKKQAEKTLNLGRNCIYDAIKNNTKRGGFRWKDITKEEYYYCKDIFETANK